MRPTVTFDSSPQSSCLCRATRVEIPWQPENCYVVPALEKDALPHAHEGTRTRL